MTGHSTSSSSCSSSSSSNSSRYFFRAIPNRCSTVISALHSNLAQQQHSSTRCVTSSSGSDSSLSSSGDKCNTKEAGSGSSSSSSSSPDVPVDLQFSLEPHIHQQMDMTGNNSSYHTSGLQQQPHRCTWPGFASLTSNSQLGQLRWKKAPSQPGDDTSSQAHQQQQQRQQQQQQQQQQQGAGPEDIGISEQQLQRDVQQLAQDVFKEGQVLAGGRYKLVTKIPISLGLADGRFTTIWHGKDLSTGNDVVLKCLEAGDATSYSSGMREAALHAAAGRCSNIVALRDAFEHRSKAGRHPVMVLEPCGSNLLNVIALYTSPQAFDANARDHTTISGICDNPQALKRLAKDTLTALDHLHKHGLVHMDLSPDNILLDREFVSQEEMHARALLPQGNFFKSLQTKWRLFQLMLQSGSRPEKAAALEEQLLGEMQASVQASASDQVRLHEGTLHTATFKLTDFGRAAPYKDILAGLVPAADLGSSSSSGSGHGQVLQRFNQDGVVVFSDPSYQPPEEILGLNYIAPSYDMWKLGCLLFESATDSKLFDNRLRVALEEAYGQVGFSDQHFLLDAMTSTLGSLPQQVGRQSPLYDDFFCSQKAQQHLDEHARLRDKQGAKQKQQRKQKKGAKEQSDLLLIHAGPLKATPGAQPLQQLLLERTVLNDQEAQQFAAFLSEVLKWEPDRRATAEQLLQHSWLQSIEPLQEGPSKGS